MRPAVVVPIALALAAAVALVIRAALPPRPVAHLRPDDTPADQAADLRQEALDACEAHRWKNCLDRLDEARALDPSGDENPEVQALRHAAAEGAGHP